MVGSEAIGLMTGGSEVFGMLVPVLFWSRLFGLLADGGLREAAIRRSLA